MESGLKAGEGLRRCHIQLEAARSKTGKNDLLSGGEGGPVSQDVTAEVLIFDDLCQHTLNVRRINRYIFLVQIRTFE